MYTEEERIVQLTNITHYKEEIAMTLSDNNKYQVISKTIYEKITYYYLVDINDISNIKFLFFKFFIKFLCFYRYYYIL